MSIRFLVESHYAQKRADLAFWRPHFEAALARCDQSGVLTPLAGDATNVVYALGSDRIAKAYTPFAQGRESHGMEEAALRTICMNDPTFPCPRILAKDALTPELEDWKWPLLVFERLPGVQLDSVLGEWDEARWEAFAFEAGKLCRRLHRVVVSGAAAERYRQLYKGGFGEFLRTRRDLRAATAEIATVPVVAELLNLDVGTLAPAWPVLVHGDLEPAHWFLTDGGLAMIDFGDAKLADPVWELVAIAGGLLERKACRLKQFMDGYGADLAAQPNFATKLGAYALLYEWVSPDFIKQWANESGANTLDEFGRWFWPT